MRHLTSMLTGSVLFQLILGTLLKYLYPEVGFDHWLSWSDMAVILLFATVGLQLKFERMSSQFILACKVVFVTTVVPLVLLYSASRFFNFTPLSSLAAAVVLTTTGTGVTIQTLSSLRLIGSYSGQFLILISALDDIPAALLMALLLNQTSGPAPFPLYWTLLAFFLFLAGKFLRQIWPLSMCFILLAISIAKILEAQSISLVMGGLIAGLVIRSIFLKKAEDTVDKINLCLNPILPFYVIGVGMKLTPKALLNPKSLLIVGTLTLLACLTKFATTFYLVKKEMLLNKYLISWGLVPRGLPGFAFATSAVSAGIIGSELFNQLIAVVCLSTWIGLVGIEVSANKMLRS